MSEIKKIREFVDAADYNESTKLDSVEKPIQYEDYMRSIGLNPDDYKEAEDLV